MQLQHILELYERCSGQMINRAKSVVLYSKNTKARDREDVQEVLNVTREIANENYLGLPCMWGGKNPMLLHI